MVYCGECCVSVFAIVIRNGLICTEKEEASKPVCLFTDLPTLADQYGTPVHLGGCFQETSLFWSWMIDSRCYHPAML